MDVIGAGFGRTGTLSLRVALEQLGYGPCYHMAELLDNPGHARWWNAAARGRLPDWEKLLVGYRATVDWPGAYFWRELMVAYPYAKVILTVRDPQRWHDSARATIFRAATGGWRERVPMLARMLLKPASMQVFRVMRSVIMNGVFAGVNMRDRQQVIEVFTRHNEEVERVVPAERLLVYDPAQGWEPLCAFLGVEVPESPFPRLNDTATFDKTFGRRMRRVTLADAAPVLGTVAGATLLAALAFRRKARSGR